jgi:hypothetical protein
MGEMGPIRVEKNAYGIRVRVKESNRYLFFF